MTDQDLPAPLVPPDVDIAGFARFMLDVDRLFASELWALSTGEEFKAAMALWGRAWQQTPAGSLPDDDRLLAAFSGVGKRWSKVRAMALRGFVKCSDGRLYHRVLCEEVLRASKHKREQHERTLRATEARRKRGDDQPTPPVGGKKRNGFNENDDRHVERHDDRHEERDVDRYDARHEDRHVRHMHDVTSNVTRSNRQDRTEERDSLEQQRDPEPARAAAAAPADWKTRPNFDRIEARCRTTLGAQAPNDPQIGPMAKLEADGFDLEAEILPALLDAAAGRKRPIGTWRLFADIVRERLSVQRLTRVAEGKPATPLPAKPTVSLGSYGNWPEHIVVRLIAECRANPHAWQTHLMGPRPGEPGCKIPARLLVGEVAA